MNNHRIEKMLRVRDVAERLGVSDRTVFRWLKEGKMTCHRLGSNLRISEADLEDFLDAAKVQVRRQRV